jgi:hypothetical protein
MVMANHLNSQTREQRLRRLAQQHGWRLENSRIRWRWAMRRRFSSISISARSSSRLPPCRADRLDASRRHDLPGPLVLGTP